MHNAEGRGLGTFFLFFYDNLSKALSLQLLQATAIGESESRIAGRYPKYYFQKSQCQAI